MMRWILVVALVSGCQSPKESARETFSQDNTCPASRVEAHERADLKPSMFVEGSSEPTPPKDIAADPERLKMWRDERAKRANAKDGHFDMTGARHIVEVRGCAKHVYYECHLPQSGSGAGPRFLCTEEQHVPATVSSTL